MKPKVMEGRVNAKPNAGPFFESDCRGLIR
jgi:hypothetical protein